MENLTFLENFNEMLEENKLNRKQFAERSGIPYTTVMGWTNLGRLPDYTALIKIADFFQCSVDFLVGRQDEINYDNALLVYNPTEQALLKNFRSLHNEKKELVIKLVKSLGE
ncbi:MAG: helix-turn-helix domain-containing protein [Clostridia bacterium]|nr:helix-turn-helix domain-containing protein [Clostridia bacterium]